MKPNCKQMKLNYDFLLKSNECNVSPIGIGALELCSPTLSTRSAPLLPATPHTGACLDAVAAIKAGDALSDTQRKRVNDWFSNTALTRLNDKRTGAVIVVMQRLHDDDLAAHAAAHFGRRVQTHQPPLHTRVPKGRDGGCGDARGEAGDDILQDKATQK